MQSENKFYCSVRIAISAILIALFLILIQKIIEVQRKNRILQKLIQQKEREKEMLQKEIELRNRKLSARALYLSDRNQLINTLLLSIESTQDLSRIPDLETQIKHLKEHIKKDNQWETFITHFEEVNPDFLRRLRKQHPKLTSNDIRFIAYTSMNLTVKEISSLLNITVYASKKRKARIISKMNLPEEVTLYSYLSSF